MKDVRKVWFQLLIAVTVFSASALAYAADTTNTHSDSPMVNVNSASEAELAFLPGVGPSTAKRIVAYRAKQPFQQEQHLMRVKGIGRKTFLKLKPFICVKGATTATKKIKISK
ncbi:MAG: helix-hairpin-helix domain-containing protein [Deltaproteobacteria bacterium]|nr:helix-hairpin-helix domain-containing protein [Deltaproteobacteria bacterium]MBN2672161.1 helix-hairpin-helix domain-containing protein [Deltaproteobacteria bacterium]